LAPRTGESAPCLTEPFLPPERRPARAGLPWGLAVAVGSLLVSLTLLGCDRSATDHDAPVAVALDDADADIARGISDLFAAVRAAPQSGELRGRLAMAYEMNGFPEAALATYAQAATLNPEEFAWPYFRALLLGRSGDLPAALGSVEQAITIDQDYVPAWLWKGKWLMETGDEEAAEIAYRRAQDLGAGSPAIAGLAQIRLRQDRPGQAAALLESVSAERSHPQLHRMLGEAYRSLGRDDDARIAFARGKLASPLEWFDPRQFRKTEYVWGFKNQMAHAGDLLHSGMTEEALAILDVWKDSYPDDPALLTNLGWAYLNLDNLDRAHEILLRGVSVHSSNQSVAYHFHFHLGRLYVRWRDDEKSLFHLERAAELNPAQPYPHEERGKILLRQGRTDEGLEAFDLAVQKGIPNPDNLLHAAGVAEAARGRWPEAIERFRQATAANPAFTEAYLHLARSLGQAGRFDEAREALDWAARLGTHPGAVASARRILASGESSEADEPLPGGV